MLIKGINTSVNASCYLQPLKQIGDSLILSVSVST